MRESFRDTYEEFSKDCSPLTSVSFEDYDPEIGLDDLGAVCLGTAVGCPADQFEMFASQVIDYAEMLAYYYKRGDGS